MLDECGGEKCEGGPYAFESRFGGQAGFGIVLAADGRCRDLSQHILYRIPYCVQTGGFSGAR